MHDGIGCCDHESLDRFPHTVHELSLDARSGIEMDDTCIYAGLSLYRFKAAVASLRDMPSVLTRYSCLGRNISEAPMIVMHPPNLLHCFGDVHFRLLELAET